MVDRKKLSVLDYPQVAIDFTPKIPPIKKIKDQSKINIRYCLISPFTYAHIYWDPKEYEVLYDIEEPILTSEELKYKEQFVSTLRSMINFEEIVGGDQETLFEYIDKRLKLLAIELGIDLTYESYKKIYYYLCRDFIGFNETEPLLRDYFCRKY